MENEIDIKDYVHMYRKCTTFNNIHCKKDKIEKNYCYYFSI